ncbi:MAG TPA: DUF6600 domain-containing protein [Chitinophagaceae bacterium]|nr:DUF6600 domain-containing protein [Chitinophagaceae bacterium]
MKRILKIAVPAFLLALGSMIRIPASAQVSVNVSYQTFYDELSPYGQWIDYPEYGYVWHPDAGNDFRPYATNGHWVWSDDYEWMWVSDYDWGWAPFHYGRWQYDDYYGWFWVPGYEWAPAWVAWRSGGDYYGWAPLRPGFNISIGFGNYNPPDDYWYFAPRRYITSPRIYDYCMDRRQNTIIIHNTIFINNNNNRFRNVYVNGPRRDECERYTGRLSPVRFRDSYSPGRTTFRNNEVSVYRPNVQQDNSRRFAPRQFERFDRQRSNDTRTGSNDNNFRRNNNVSTDRGNNLPTRRDDKSIRRDDNTNVPRDDNNNGRFERKDNSVVRQQPRNDIRQPRVDNTPQDNGRFERKDNEVIRQRNNNGNNPFERRQPVMNNNDQPKREQSPRVERQQPSTDNGRFENRRVENNNSNRSSEQPRQFERRQVEKKDNGNNGNNGNGGRGNGKRRN